MGDRRRATVLSIAAIAAFAAGCGAAGGGGDDRPEQAATLVLDFQPNAVHAGIYQAVASDFDDAEGVTLTVRAPSSSTDAVKFLLARRARFAILDIHDLALAREKGRDVMGVMAVVQRPLAAVMAQPSVSRPRDLEGRRAGVTGVPSDDAVLDTVVRGDGADPRKVRRVTIGFRAVPALLARRVDAATAFWNAEGVALKARRPRIREFRVDRYGAPPYPELVLAASGRTVREDAPLVRATVAALRRGYRQALVDPESAVGALVDRAKGVDRAQALREFDAVAPALGAAPGVGVLDRERLRAWGRWEAEVGITKDPVDPDRAFAGLR